jgi:hypothetical protein
MIFPLTTSTGSTAPVAGWVSRICSRRAFASPMVKSEMNVVNLVSFPRTAAARA